MQLLSLPAHVTKSDLIARRISVRKGENNVCSSNELIRNNNVAQTLCQTTTGDKRRYIPHIAINLASVLAYNTGWFSKYFLEIRLLVRYRLHKGLPFPEPDTSDPTVPLMLMWNDIFVGTRAGFIKFYK
jgi:hypothetical protein